MRPPLHPHHPCHDQPRAGVHLAHLAHPLVGVGGPHLTRLVGMTTYSISWVSSWAIWTYVRFLRYPVPFGGITNSLVGLLSMTVITPSSQ